MSRLIAANRRSLLVHANLALSARSARVLGQQPTLRFVTALSLSCILGVPSKERRMRDVKRQRAATIA
jgi:hypothetical protein